MSTRVYNSDEVTASFAGVPIEEPADGTFITIRWLNDAFASTVGAHGQVARSRTNDNRAEIEITLMQTSPTNAALSAIWLADKNSPGGAGIGGFLVADLNGTSLHTAGNAWIKRSPDVEYANEPGTRVWLLECDNLRDFTGGNL